MGIVRSRRIFSGVQPNGFYPLATGEPLSRIINFKRLIHMRDIYCWQIKQRKLQVRSTNSSFFKLKNGLLFLPQRMHLMFRNRGSSTVVV